MDELTIEEKINKLLKDADYYKGMMNWTRETSDYIYWSAKLSVCGDKLAKLEKKLNEVEE